MTTDRLLADWLALSEAEREKLLLLLRASLVQRLDAEDDFPLSDMHVCAAFRRGSTLSLHVVTDQVEYRPVQSGSDGDDHTIWEIDAVFTLSHALVSAEFRPAYDHFIIEYDLEHYKPQDVVAEIVERFKTRLLSPRGGL